MRLSAILLIWGLVAGAVHATEDIQVVPVPDEVKRFLDLKPFYTKYASAKGIPVLSSDKPRDLALIEAAYLINRMMEGMDDVRDAIIESKIRFSVMAYNEFTTEIPEHSDLTPKDFYDRRARGLGATRVRPAVSCGEENLLELCGDPYHEENLLIHEFAHVVQDIGLKQVKPEIYQRIRKAYDQAMEEGLWKGKYASHNFKEYWAEGVQSWFGTNRLPDHDHNHVDTREELKKYDPRLAALIDEVFQNKDWQYQVPGKRKKPGHMKDWDPKKAPCFEWPERLKKVNLDPVKDR